MLSSCQRRRAPPEYQCTVQKKLAVRCFGDSSGGRQVEQIPCCPHVHTSRIILVQTDHIYSGKWNWQKPYLLTLLQTFVGSYFFNNFLIDSFIEVSIFKELAS